MILEMLQTNNNDLSHGEFILLLRSIADKLEVHPVLSTFAEHVPGPAMYRQLADQLTKEYEIFGKNGGKLPTRPYAQEAIQVTATHLCMIAWHRKDPTVLDNVGLEHKERIYTKQTDIVPSPPEKLVLKNEGGSVWVTFSGLPRKATVELQINDRDPADESAWASFATFFNSRNELKGLARVKEYWFRARFHSAGGTSGWSVVASHVVV